jgi:hypothetical protein
MPHPFVNTTFAMLSSSPDFISQSNECENMVSTQMNRLQRKLVLKWFGLAALFVGVPILERVLKNSPGLFKGILFLAMVAALLYEGPIPRPAESNSTRIDRIVSANPWIKIWLGVCALSGTALAVAAIWYDLDLDKRLGFGGLLAAPLLIGAPILIMSERERFLACATSDDAVQQHQS